MLTSKKIFDKSIVLFLRIITMGVKFLFFSLLLPKLLSVEDYGILNLLTTTITFFIFFIGFDFYNFSHREIINDSKENVKSKIFNQIFFTFLIFLFLIPLLYLLFHTNNFPYFTVVLFLLYSEYVGQEIYRLLILFSRPILGNLALFFRSSLWIVALYLITKYTDSDITIYKILVYWLIGNYSLIFLILFYFLFSKKLNLNEVKVDFKWIKLGVIVSLPFLISTIALKIIELSDRFLINYFLNETKVGIYSFYSNVSNTLNVFINTAVVIIIYPRILKAYQQKNCKKEKSLIKEYKKEMFLFLAIFGVLISILIFPIIKWIGKEIYSNEIVTFFVLLSANIIFNISLIPHIILYVRNKDKQLIKPIVLACLINIILNAFLIPFAGILGAATATFVGFFIIALLKYRYVVLLKNNT